MEKLALEGGPKTITVPLPPWPFFDVDERGAVEEVLLSGKVNYWTGDHGKLFEAEMATYCGRKHGIAVFNGTVALELALLAFDIGGGDDVIVTCRTFIASASCAVMRGARPILADIDPDSQNITAETIHKVLTPKTKAIICVHLAGWPCDMDSIMALAKEKGLVVIEDCAQAHGATYKGKPIGSFGHAAAFSFCQDKIMTTGGEGGMLVLDDEAAWKKAWSYKDHGKDFDLTHQPHQSTGFKWVHESFGTNWRMTEIQSVLGRLQLKKLDSWVATRRKWAAVLNEGLRASPAIRTTVPPKDFGHSYYKFYFFVRPEHLKPTWNRERIQEAINAEGLPCFTGSCSEIYLEKAFAAMSWQPAERFAIAKELGETSLMVQVHPTLPENLLSQALQGIRKVFSHAAL